MSETNDTVMANANAWLEGNIDYASKAAIRDMMEHDRKELTESFYKDLEFGTGGLRGIMGVGTNRMNKYTVGMATQGLVNYLKKLYADDYPYVAMVEGLRTIKKTIQSFVASYGTVDPS